MKRKQVYHAIFAVYLLAAGIFFMGCDNLSGGGDGGIPFVAVTGITGVPAIGTAGEDLVLSGTVGPEDATNQTIEWAVKIAGTTAAGASIREENILSATGAGFVVVTATIADGLEEGTPYTEDFAITITSISLPAYTMKPVPAGEVTTDNTGAGSVNWGPSNNNQYPFPKPWSTNGFSIGETEVTYELWKAVYDWATDNARGTAAYTFINPGQQGAAKGGISLVSTDQHPVTTISWRDAVVWCNAYSEAMGKEPAYYLQGTTDFTDTTKVLRKSEDDTVSAGDGEAEQAVIDPDANGFRLPDEAEWEYAARGGVPSQNEPWTFSHAGSNTVGDVAVYNVNQTAEVKSKDPNTLGLYDMCGNAEEWCWNIGSTNPGNKNRAARSSAYLRPVNQTNIVYRNSGQPHTSHSNFGFRVLHP